MFHYLQWGWGWISYASFFKGNHALLLVTFKWEWRCRFCLAFYDRIQMSKWLPKSSCITISINSYVKQIQIFNFFSPYFSLYKTFTIFFPFKLWFQTQLKVIPRLHQNQTPNPFSSPPIEFQFRQCNFAQIALAFTSGLGSVCKLAFFWNLYILWTECLLVKH